MGKRSNFERNPRDFYKTPYEATVPLLKYVARKGATFVEPCAGDGRLVRHLERHDMKCVFACDIEPQAENIEKRDVLFFGGCEFPATDYIITNPPWERNRDGTGSLHEMIELFRVRCVTWLLFDSDWMFSDQAIPFFLT